jgi:hypothetical protein
MTVDERRLWQSSGLATAGSVAGIAPAGVHIFRHTAAKLRRDAGESMEDVSRFLDHSRRAGG